MLFEGVVAVVGAELNSESSLMLRSPISPPFSSTGVEDFFVVSLLSLDLAERTGVVVTSGLLEVPKMPSSPWWLLLLLLLFSPPNPLSSPAPESDLIVCLLLFDDEFSSISWVSLLSV